MRHITEHTRRSGKAAFCAALAIFAASAAAGAAPIVDGLFDPTEGYTTGRYVEFAIEKVSTIVTGGQLWTYQDPVSRDVYVYFSQPVTLVDNTYGKNAVGWGHDAPSGKDHKFDDLVGSDKAQFVFTNAAGQTVLDVNVDYLHKAGSTYRSLGVTGGDGRVNLGSAASVLEWGTSLDYNFNTLGYVLTKNSPATDANYTENPSYPGWLFEVAYELRIAGSAFGDSGYGGVFVPLVHDSPNKIGDNKVYPRVDGVIPEPMALTLMALGGVLITCRKRRKRR